MFVKLRATQLLTMSDWTKGPGRSKLNPLADPALKMSGWLAESKTKTLEDWTSMLGGPGGTASDDDWLSTATTFSTLEDHTPTKQPRISAHRMDWMQDFGTSPTSRAMHADDDFVDEDDNFNYAEDVISNDGY